MTALAVVGATQMNQGLAPKSASSGGTSQSDPGAGGGASTDTEVRFSAITTADKAGAAILTILVVVALVGGGIWIIL